MSRFPSTEVADPRLESRNRRYRGTVVVTGASSGIGESTALHLASLGYRVLAGVRKQADFERMRNLPAGLEPVMLDITDQGQIAALVELVERTTPEGLAALVNNAGIGIFGPFELLTTEQWQRCFDTNVIGTASVTRALLPNLIRSRGRIINIGSGGGRVAFPLFSPYTASKFALEGFTDGLRREVGRHGVKVVCVQPGVISTPIYENGLPECYAVRDRMTPDEARRYGTMLDSAIKSAEEARDGAAPPIIVAQAVAKALGARWPRTRYVVGWDSRTAVICARILPDRLIDFIIGRLTAN
jgi:NAD(P)-dependent dehydrogenase (short-subunit alcohol dehydrogenase family)